MNKFKSRFDFREHGASSLSIEIVHGRIASEKCLLIFSLSTVFVCTYLKKLFFLFNGIILIIHDFPQKVVRSKLLNFKISKYSNVFVDKKRRMALHKELFIFAFGDLHK